MTDFKYEPKKSFEDDIMRRLSALEAHLINLIVPIQNLRHKMDKLEKKIVERNVRVFVDDKEMIPGDDTVYMPKKKAKKHR